MARWLIARSVLAEDLSSIPNTQFRRLTNAYNDGCRRMMPLASVGTELLYTHPLTDVYITKLIKINH